MSEMVERIARIVDPDAFDPLPGHEEGKCIYCDANRNVARELASRIIEAMREPTEAMLNKRIELFMVHPAISAHVNRKTVWQALIDSALKD